MAGGRPTKYLPIYANIARVMSLEGSRPATIAAALGCNHSTLQDWCKKHPDLKAAMRAADDETVKVVASILKLAKGFTRKTVRPITISIGNGMTEIVDHPVREYFPPNLQAGLRWMKVHRPEIWGDAGNGTVKAPKDEAGVVEIPASVLKMLVQAAEAKQSGATH